MGIRNLTRRHLLCIAGAAASFGVPATLRAQPGFPSKPIRILVPFPAGGGGDVSVRLVAKPLSAALGVPVVVDNKPGADGAIASSELIRSAPDGQTIMFGSPSALLFVPLINVTKPPYDTLKDFEPVSHFISFTYFLYVNEGVPVNTIQEFLAYVRRNPGKVAYGTGDSTSLIALAQLAMHANLDMTHVPYKGNSQALTDFAGGRIQVMVGGIDIASQMPGKAKPLAVLLAKRSPLMPDVPTFAEAGLPQVNLRPWTGFFAPPKTPKPILDRLSTEMAGVFKQPELQEFFSSRGSQLEATSPEAMRNILVEQIPIWREAIKFAKIPTQ